MLFIILFVSKFQRQYETKVCNKSVSGLVSSCVSLHKKLPIYHQLVSS